MLVDVKHQMNIGLNMCWLHLRRDHCVLTCMKQTKRNWIEHMLAAPEKRALCANVHEANKQKWIEHMLAAHEKRP